MIAITQVAEQLWKADDGNVFETKEECLFHETAVKAIRYLYEELGIKNCPNNLGDYEEP